MVLKERNTPYKIKAAYPLTLLDAVPVKFRAKNPGEGSIDYQLAKAEWEGNQSLSDLL